MISERVQLRLAHPGEAPGLLRVKQALRFDWASAEPGAAVPRGGFLLGTTLEQYAAFIARDEVLVLDEPGGRGVVGFSIMLSQASVLRSELWQKAGQVRWQTGFEQAFSAAEGDGSFAFYEQLGVLPGEDLRVYAKYLAFNSVWRALQRAGHLFTTLLRYPVYNPAARPFLEVAGFESRGLLEEHYPEYGRVVSEVFHLERESFERRLQEPRFARFLQRARRQGLLLELAA